MKTILLILAVSVAAALALSAVSLPGQNSSASRAPDHHVLVISVDGMGADFYRQAALKVHLTNLERLRSEGSYAEAVEGVYPSVTYPSHTTIVTGCLPAEHGIYSNNSSRLAGKNTEDWFWFAKDIRVPTLWDEARRAHVTSAAISWPVTVGAALDWNVPEVWDPGKGEEMDLKVLAKYSTPGLIEEAVQNLGPTPPGTDNDEIRTRFAAYLLKRSKPNLVLVHLANLDGKEHDYGPASRQAAEALESIDQQIGELLAAVREAGLGEATDVFIVSDHGFLPVDREIRPNVLLVKAGLLTAERTGRITGGKIATLSNGGSFFVYWPDSENLRSQVDGALRPLRDQGMFWAEFDRGALRDFGAEPTVKLALDAPTGYAFSSRANGDVRVRRKSTGGTHGYLPFRSGLEASFIAWGPHIRQGVDLHRIPMTAIGPTILKAMGISDPRFGAHAPLNDIFK